MDQFLKKFLDNLGRVKYYLIIANFLLVFFLILLSNLKVLPLQWGDFIFFSFIYLIFALYRPGWSFLFFIGTIALENINLAPLSLGLFVRPYQLIGSLTIFSLLLRYFTKRLNFELVKLKWFDYAIGIFALLGFFSTFFALNKGLALKQSIIIATFVALYWLVRNYIQSLDDLKRLTPFFLGSSVIIVFYGIWQNVRFLHGGSSFEVMPGRPNGTFAEADWLGIYLVLLMAIMYLIIFYINKSIDNKGSIISNDQLPISNKILNPKFQIPNSSLYLTVCYSFLMAIFILLILTVSRSAWLGAGFVTLVFLKAIFTNFSFKYGEWNWKEFLRHLAFIFGSIITSLIIIYIFHLTNFQLFNRAQSSGSGLQKITIACSGNIQLPEKIGNVSELEKYNCRHINLEYINKERDSGFEIREIYRIDPNVNIRSKIYQKSWEEIKNHPALGIGWGNISSILGKDERGTGLNSSNIFLEAWLGSGLIGLLAFLSIWVYIFIKSVLYCIANDGESKITGLFMISGLFALLIPNMFNSGSYLGILWVYFGIALSLSIKKS